MPSWHRSLKWDSFSGSLRPPFIRDQCMAVISMSYPLMKKAHLFIFYQDIFFTNSIQFRRFSHSSFCSMFVPTLKDKLQQRYWISLHVWKHVATITQIPKHYLASRELNLTPADCRCNCTIIRAASCQAKLSFHYRFLPLSKWTLYTRHKYSFVFLYLPSFSTWEQVMQVTQMIEGWRQILWG